MLKYDLELHVSSISKITMASQGHEVATVSAEEYNAIFGYSDSEVDEGDSDIDLPFSEDESESSESPESEEGQDEDESCWTDQLTNIEVGDFVSPTGISLRLSHEAKEVDLFKLLIDDGIIEHIVTETNCYAQQKLSENPQRLNKWREVTAHELKAYFGVCIIMGINSLPSTADYWSADQYIGNMGIQKVMTKNCFEEINCFLHLNNSAVQPQQGEDNYDCLYKV